MTGRQAPPAARGGHDRWLISYADLVTLLLAVFTTLYAASTIDAQKLGPISSSIRDALDTSRQPDPAAPAALAARPVPAAAAPAAAPALVPPVAVVAAPNPDADLRRRLAEALSQALAADRIRMHRDARGLILSLPEEAAFPVGKADVSAEARKMIDRIATAVAPAPNAIRIEGHTDDVPIRTSRYRSNWELSTARASAVVEYLVTVTGLAPARLSAAGYGEFHPRVPNDSAQNRASNRRIDIVILDREAK